jgi:excisionase family DNA binding protein
MVRLLTVKEAAEALRVSEATVRALVGRKLLRHERVGVGRGRIRIPVDAIEEYRKNRTVAAVGGEGTRPAPAARKTKHAFKHIRVN